MLSALYMLSLDENGLAASPPHQVMNHHAISEKNKNTLMEVYGGQSILSAGRRTGWTALLHQLKDPKVNVLTFAYSMCFGLFLGMTTSFDLPLIALGYSAEDASLITGVFSLSSQGFRALAGLWLDLDCLGGGLTYTAGGIVSITAMLLSAIPDETPKSTVMATITLLAFSTGINAAANIYLTTTESRKKHSNINPSRANGQISSVGAASGAILYNLLAAHFAAQYKNNPGQGYLKVFFPFAALTALSCILVGELSVRNRAPSRNAFFQGEKGEGNAGLEMAAVKTEQVRQDTILL